MAAAAIQPPGALEDKAEDKLAGVGREGEITSGASYRPNLRNTRRRLVNPCFLRLASEEWRP